MKVIWPNKDELSKFTSIDPLNNEYYNSLRKAIESLKETCCLDVNLWKTGMHKWSVKRREEIICEYVSSGNDSIEIRVKGREAIIYFTITK
jgi:hypothetical protein